MAAWASPATWSQGVACEYCTALGDRLLAVVGLEAAFQPVVEQGAMVS